MYLTFESIVQFDVLQNVDSKKIRSIFKESALGRFFHRVAMSVYISIYLSIYLYVPFSCNFLCGTTGVERHSSKNWCGASVAHVWSPKNEGWVQSVHRPRVEP